MCLGKLSWTFYYGTVILTSSYGAMGTPHNYFLKKNRKPYVGQVMNP